MATIIPFSADTNGVGSIIAGTQAVTGSSGMYFQNDGRVLLFAQDNTGNTGTVTVESVNDPYGRSVDSNTVTCTTGSLVKFGPFPPAAWNNADGTVSITCTNVTTLKVFAVRI